MFLKNKYTLWYQNLINRAVARPKFKGGEWHHPIPKSLGGDINIRVQLTAREHFICHLLLTKMLEGEAKSKMCWALHRMMYSKTEKMQRYKPSSHTYEHFRKTFYAQIRGKKRELTKEHLANIIKANQARKGRKESEETRAKHRANRTGSTLTIEHRLAISLAHKGKKLSLEHRANISKARSFKKHSEESKKKISEANKLLPRKHLMVDGIEYKSCDEASRITGIAYATLYAQARNPLKQNVHFLELVYHES